MNDIIERLRSTGALPICPYDKRSPEYYTTPDDKPCKFCGGLPDGPDKCTGGDMRIMAEAADEIERLRALTSPQLHQHGGGVEEAEDGRCPRPCNGRPDDFSMRACIEAGECGCIAFPALAQQPLSVPEGWKLVPLAPTNIQYEAAWHIREIERANGTIQPDWTWTCAQIYHGMLAAAPAHPTQSDVSCSRAREGGAV